MEGKGEGGEVEELGREREGSEREGREGKGPYRHFFFPTSSPGLQSLRQLRGRCITITIPHNTACLERR